MKLILASNNKGKVVEFREILAGTGIEVIPQREAGCDFEVDETGETFEENAFLKAEAAMKATGLPAVSDDSDLDRRKFLMKKLEGEEHRTARFVSAICCVFPNGDVLRARGTCEGRIATYMKGENGFGYDAMFIAEGHDITMAEMTHEQKNEISHRGRALREFARVLKEYCNADK